MPQETVRDKINLAIKAHLAGGMPRIGEEFALTDDIISSISKLILEAVGEDRECGYDSYISGYNQAKAEIREALRKIGVE
jgi:hypothetical protein